MEGDELGMKVCFVLERFSLPFSLRGGFADASLAGALKSMYPGEGLPSKDFRSSESLFRRRQMAFFIRGHHGVLSMRPSVLVRRGVVA